MSALPAFADPLWLLALAAVPLLALLHHRHGGRGAFVYSRLPARAGSTVRLHLPFYLRLGALVVLVVALARPQLGYAWEESTTEGIDIQLALDVSGSMAAEDFEPNRLEAAKRVARDFVARRPADRIGITTFSGSAVLRAPLTNDRRMLDEILAGIDITTEQDGTAIGVALANAANRLKESAAKSRVVVLVTDGVNNAGEIDPASASAVAQGLGLKVYPVAVGTAGEALIRVRERNERTGEIVERKVSMRVEVDEELLQRIAARTGGRFYRATDPGALAQVFDEIDRLERTPLEVKRYVRYQVAFQPFAWAG
ncbi:MAG: VWA domain-containing protein, partial [Myxococcota bacterium]